MSKKAPQSLTYTERHTMYNLLPLMARTAVICIVPKAIDAAHSAFFKTKPKLPKLPGKKAPIKRIRTKKVDMTKITREHYDHIIFMHKALVAYNLYRSAQDKIQNPEFITGLNTEFGMDKAAPAFSGIYNNRVERDSLHTANEPILKYDPPKIGKYKDLLDYT